MNFATPQLAQEIAALMSHAAEVPGIDPTELDAAKQFDALPINGDYAPYLLRADGTVVLCGETPDVPHFANDQQSLLRAIVYASKRYPSLAKFIPLRPADSNECSFCKGTGVRRDVSVTCPVCVGLGWVVGGA
jgi:hypothetical protein